MEGYILKAFSLAQLLPLRLLYSTWLWCVAKVAEVTFSDSDSIPVSKILSWDPDPKFFKFENLTPVQTPATIDATDIQHC